MRWGFGVVFRHVFWLFGVFGLFVGFGLLCCFFSLICCLLFFSCFLLVGFLVGCWFWWFLGGGLVFCCRGVVFCGWVLCFDFGLWRYFSVVEVGGSSFFWVLCGVGFCFEFVLVVLVWMVWGFIVGFGILGLGFCVFAWFAFGVFCIIVIVGLGLAFCFGWFVDVCWVFFF